MLDAVAAPADYYDQHAEAFFQASAFADLGGLHSRFLEHLPTDADILDAGCGSGRDALAFHRAGHRVTAFDASPELVRLAREHTGLPVLWMRFEDMTWDAAFDGIWACASLLHVPRAELPQAFSRLARALRPGGVAYLSMKQGSLEREEDGRHFTDVMPHDIADMTFGAGFQILDVWLSEDVRPDRTQTWVNALVQRLA